METMMLTAHTAAGRDLLAQMTTILSARKRTRPRPAAAIAKLARTEDRQRADRLTDIERRNRA